MRHLYRCPLRWADLDLLGHVNNVAYADLLQEARVELLAAHPSFRGGSEITEGLVVARHELDYLRPLGPQREPVTIQSWVSQVRAASFTVDYEVYAEGEAPYLRAATQLVPFGFGTGRPRRIDPREREVLAPYAGEPGPRRPLQPESGLSARHRYPLRVRWSDMDAYRHVNNVAFLEFFQEARVAYITELSERVGVGWAGHVVARTEIGYRAPMVFRLEPYEVRSWVSRVGERSFVISGEVADGEQVFAHAAVLMVAVDTTGGSTALGLERQAMLAEELAAAR